MAATSRSNGSAKKDPLLRFDEEWEYIAAELSSRAPSSPVGRLKPEPQRKVRRARRAQVHLPAMILAPPELKGTHCSVINLSANGVLLDSLLAPSKSGDPIRICFALPEVILRTWASQVRIVGRSSALQFMGMGQAQRSMIADYLDRFSSQAGPPPSVDDRL
jgi:hypothetical protein